VAAWGELDGTNVGRRRVHHQMHLAPLASTLWTVLAGLPFANAEELDPGAVHQRIERTGHAAIRYLHRQGLLPAAQGRKVRHGPVQSCKPKQAGHHPGGLSQGQLEQHFDRYPELDGGVGEDRRTSRAPFMRREPGHILVQPDQQRAALAQCSVVVGPVGRAVTGGRWLAHAARVTAWIRDVNRQKSEFCNNAPTDRHSC